MYISHQNIRDSVKIKQINHSSQFRSSRLRTAHYDVCSRTDLEIFHLKHSLISLQHVSSCAKFPCKKKKFAYTTTTVQYNLKKCISQTVDLHLTTYVSKTLTNADLLYKATLNLLSNSFDRDDCERKYALSHQK